MSWLYTILFAGLAFSSNGSSVQNVQPDSQITPAAIEVQIAAETEKFDQTYPFNANGKLGLSNINGLVIIEAWDRNEVKLEYTKTADTKERLADVQVKIDARADSIKIDTDYGNWKNRNNGDRWNDGGKLQVDFHLMVPRGAFLNEVETVNGSVTVSNFVNFTKISAVNGAVNASNLSGTANLSTVNGEVHADFDRLETGSKIVLSTVNGRVNLSIPSDSSATVNADSLNGNISNDFGLPVRKGKYIGRDLYGRLGAGDVRIKLDSVNGTLAIGRKSDGKNLSPATNLLPQKEKDDEDQDNIDGDNLKSQVKSAKIDKDLEKALRDTHRARAIADAQREYSRARPEITKITAEAVEKAAADVDQTMKTIDTPEFKRKIKDIQVKQSDMLVKLSNTDFDSSVSRIEKKSESFPVKDVPKVTVDAKGCSVRVQGWDKSEVQYRVTQLSDSRSLTPVKINQDHNDTSVTIKVENPDGDAKDGIFSNDARRVRIEVFVPRKSNLKIISNGEIRLDGVSGDLNLSGGDESINVRDVGGTLHVANADGRVRIVGFTGDLDATTEGGEVYLEGDFTKLSGKAGVGKFVWTVHGDPDADMEANVEAIAVENLVEPKKVSGNNWRFGKGGPKFHFTVDGGDVTVRRGETMSVP